jgi:uncharacterized protein (DUF983 family)
MTDLTPSTLPPSWPRISPIQAGLRCRCPRCGRGALYAGVLSLAACCSICDLDLSANDAGDGPAVFVILILGAIVVPLALWLELSLAPPIWVHIAIWPPVIVALSVLMLRLMKAILVAYHFQNLRHEYDG